MELITYPCLNCNKTMLVKWVIGLLHLLEELLFTPWTLGISMTLSVLNGLKKKVLPYRIQCALYHCGA